MKIISKIVEMQKLSDKWRQEGETISFVPTMGSLHKGHLSLMEEGKKRGDRLIISIFVNPTQFGAGEDFKEYPHDFKRDSELAKGVGVDVIFSPSIPEMYPEGFQSFVAIDKLTKTLCGISRPHHFQGVTTVVAKLFNIVKPHLAFFGKKDFQQLVVIQRMVKDLNYDLEVIGLPIIREDDGLAMSSRNKYLSREERVTASSLNRSLILARKMYQEGIRNAREIEKKVEQIVGENGLIKIDYIRICDQENLLDIDRVNQKAQLAVAVNIGATRLIDNCELGEEK